MSQEGSILAIEEIAELAPPYNDWEKTSQTSTLNPQPEMVVSIFFATIHIFYPYITPTL